MSLAIARRLLLRVTVGNPHEHTHTRVESSRLRYCTISPVRMCGARALHLPSGTRRRARARHIAPCVRNISEKLMLRLPRSFPEIVLRKLV